MVRSVDKCLGKYGPRKSIVFGLFIDVGRTLINPICGVVQLDRKTFSTWNAIGAVIWTQVAIGIGYLLGDALSTKANTYLYGVVAIIVLITAAPMALEVLKEWRTKRHLS
jgi:membrane-associated protein